MAKGYKTGGRQMGVPNRATIERELRARHGIQAATEDDVLPLDIMLAVMRDEPLPNGLKATDEQLRAAIAAAPYLHPRLATTTLNATVAGRSRRSIPRNCRRISVAHWRRSCCGATHSIAPGRAREAIAAVRAG
jgi:hypothetical protein